MKKSGRKPEGPIGLNKILTPDEERLFMEYMVSIIGNEGGVRDFMIFDVMLQTGLRVSELCNLRVKDTPKYLGGNVIRVHLGKGKKSRDIPISKRMAKNLSNYLKNERPATLPAAIRASDRRKPVFYSERKRPYRRDEIAYKTKKFVLRAGLIKHVTPHMCRHTFATNALLKNRATLAELQVLMGHSKIATTQKYLHTAGLLNPRLGNTLDRGEWLI